MAAMCTLVSASICRTTELCWSVKTRVWEAIMVFLYACEDILWLKLEKKTWTRLAEKKKKGWPSQIVYTFFNLLKAKTCPSYKCMLDWFALARAWISSWSFFRFLKSPFMFCVPHEYGSVFCALLISYLPFVNESLHFVQPLRFLAADLHRPGSVGENTMRQRNLIKKDKSEEW